MSAKGYGKVLWKNLRNLWQKQPTKTDTCTSTDGGYQKVPLFGHFKNAKR
jgi:hypothetical protein